MDIVQELCLCALDYVLRSEADVHDTLTKNANLKIMTRLNHKIVDNVPPS